MKTKSTDYSSPSLDVQLLVAEFGFASSTVGGGIDDMDKSEEKFIWF